jgi:hypothetical protein
MCFEITPPLRRGRNWFLATTLSRTVNWLWPSQTLDFWAPPAKPFYFSGTVGTRGQILFLPRSLNVFWTLTSSCAEGVGLFEWVSRMLHRNSTLTQLTAKGSLHTSSLRYNVQPSYVYNSYRALLPMPVSAARYALTYLAISKSLIAEF